MKLLSTVILILCSVTLFGQHNYIPFPDSGYVWRVVQYDFSNQTEDNRQYYLLGDTTIHDTIYKKLVVSNNLDPTTHSYFGGIRNDTSNRKVYVFRRSYVSEELLYDFSLTVGDTVKTRMLRYFAGLVIAKIDSILLDDGYHLQYHYYNGASDTVYPMIEGIGAVTGPISSPVHFEHGEWLICTRLKGKSHYPNSNDTCLLATGINKVETKNPKIIIFPNPVIDILLIEIGEPNIHVKSVIVYDMWGRQIINKNNLSESSVIKINVSRISPGLYNILIETHEGVFVNHKFFKE